MAKRVAIDEIIMDRVLISGDDLTELTKSIQEHGLEVPILVTQDYHLIDGLRRIEALRSLGETEVDTVPTYMYPRACEVIKQAREHGVAAAPLTPQRIWEIYTTLQPLLNITRSYNQRGKPPRSRVGKISGGRVLFSESIGIPDGQVQALVNVYNKLNHPELSERAAEALDKINRGETTFYGAVEYIRKGERFSGDISGVAQQQEIIESAITSLDGTLRALSRLGKLHKKFPKEEAEQRLTELAGTRYKLTKFIRLLTEEIKNK